MGPVLTKRKKVLGKSKLEISNKKIKAWKSYLTIKIGRAAHVATLALATQSHKV